MQGPTYRIHQTYRSEDQHILSNNQIEGRTNITYLTIFIMIHPVYPIYQSDRSKDQNSISNNRDFLHYINTMYKTYDNYNIMSANICVTNLRVIWLDSHNFLIRSLGPLLSMTSPVRVLPTSTYTSNMVPNV